MVIVLAVVVLVLLVLAVAGPMLEDLLDRVVPSRPTGTRERPAVRKR